jgi:hypothetical protein
MNILIGNQYGQVQGGVTEHGVMLAIAADTPRQESVRLQTFLDSVEQQLSLLDVLAAVERRIEQFQLRDSEPQRQEGENQVWGTIGRECDFLNPHDASKSRVYGRFAQFLIYEQLEQGRLRVFFAARDESKRIARFDLHPGEVQAFFALVKRSLFARPQIQVLVRDDISLTLALTACAQGMTFDVQTPIWHSQFTISKANDVATLGVFARRAIRRERVVPLRFGEADHHFGFRKRAAGQVCAEFQHKGSPECVTISMLELHKLELLAEFVLHQTFAPSNGKMGGVLSVESSTTAQVS